MEKQLIDLAYHVFTLEWATWAIPVSILLSFTVRRFVPTLIVAVLAVAIHNIGPIALPALLGGEGMATIMADVSATLPKVDPAIIATEYVSYVFLIFVFSLTRRDMFRDYAPE